MGISIIHGSPQIVWTPIQDAATIYTGGLVTVDTSGPTEGVIQLPDAAGVCNVTNHDIVLGLCIGTNRKTPLYNSTYKCNYITDPGATDAHDGASVEYTGVDGPWAKGDPIAMAKIAIIDPCTVLRAPLYNAAVGTAPSVVTATVASTDGLGVTTGSLDFTPTADNMSTIYCRSGANRGVYRLLDAASATVHTWDKAMRNDIAVGDTFVAAPVRYFGPSTCMFDATSASFIDVADAPVLAGTNRWSIIVLRLDLSEAGSEFVDFRFDPMHFGLHITSA